MPDPSEEVSPVARSSRKQPAGPTPVDAIRHADKRPNIPTADAHDFYGREVEEVRRVAYQRDASLDPQLIWRGKYDDDGRASDLVTDAPPIYIQEKIDPRVLIENLRRTAARPEEEPELTLFDSFDGLDELDVVEFYRHQANWSNRMILGDSLQVMSSLAERESLRGQVQMVYIDPPYGIKFGSNWQVSARKRDVKDGRLEDATIEAEQIKAFRDTWELGIHSYLSYLRTGSWAPASCSPSLAPASSRSATRTCTWCGASGTKSSGARTSSVKFTSRQPAVSPRLQPSVDPVT